MKSTAIIATALITLTSGAAFAHSNTARQYEQLDRIEQGREEGSITWTEGIKLRREQATIAQRKIELESDGRLSRADKRELYEMQNRAGAHITHEANDGWRRLWWWPRFAR